MAARLSTVFTKRDLETFRRRAELKAELAEVEAELRPKIENAINKCGAGEHTAHGVNFILKKVVRTNTKWKGIAQHFATEKQINSVLDDYATLSNVYSMNETIDTE